MAEDFVVYAELIAAGATVASLIYVGLQIRQNTRATRATSVREYLYRLSEWQREIAGNGEFARLFHQSVEIPPSDYSQDEWNRLTSYFFSLFHIYEAQYINAKFEVGMGMETEPYLRDARTVIETFPNFKRFWELEKAANRFTPGFVEAVEAIPVGTMGGYQPEEPSA